jgi:hypothetical protein
MAINAKILPESEEYSRRKKGLAINTRPGAAMRVFGGFSGFSED